jgi:hypothetical protein
MRTTARKLGGGVVGVPVVVTRTPTNRRANMDDIIKKAASLPDAIGDALSDFGGFLRCETCHRTAELGDPGRRVTGQGWPKCCGLTMHWWTQSQIDAGEVPEVASRW